MLFEMPATRIHEDGSIWKGSRAVTQQMHWLAWDRSFVEPYGKMVTSLLLEVRRDASTIERGT